jgi:hypothetical protein
VEQGDVYYVQFNAFDEDDVNTFEWCIETNARFLEINNKSGVLTGTPENDDVGNYFVNTSATDLRGLSDWLNYSLEVINVNDPPEWISIPLDTEVEEGRLFTFDVDAIDIDTGDSVSYSISSHVDSSISIDPETGVIIWNASIEGLVAHPYYVLNVEITSSDGIESITHSFTIRVNPNPSPSTKLLKPDDIGKITSKGTTLEWEYEDDGYGLVLFDVYLGKSYTAVSMCQSETLLTKDITTTFIDTGELDKGTTYYWTVFPKDIFSTGYCKNDVYSFKVNTPPELVSIDDKTITPGRELTLTFESSDLDSDLLEFSLIEAPEGMELYSNMKTIYWTPTIHQVGDHVVVIDAFDGLEHSNISFKVTVEEAFLEPGEDEGGSSIVLIIIIILVVVLIMIGAGIGVFLFLKKKKESGPEEKTEGSPTQHENPELTEQGKEVFDKFFGQK